MTTSKILVTAGVNPDLDGVASALAYVELARAQGQTIIAAFEGDFQLDAQFFLDYLNIRLPQIGNKAESVILVDCSAKFYTPRLVAQAPEIVVEVIDHREIHNAEIDFPAVKRTMIESVGACATLVAEMLFAQQHIPSQAVASLLYGAIHSNTLNMKASVTTDRDRAAIEQLEPLVDNAHTLINDMFIFRTQLTGEQLTFTLKNDFDANIESPYGTIGIAQIEAFDASGLFANYQDLIRQLLLELQAKHKLDYVFLTVPSIHHGVNFLYAPNEASAALVQRYLEPHLDASETAGSAGQILLTKRLLMRKEIRPLFQRILS